VKDFLTEAERGNSARSFALAKKFRTRVRDRIDVAIDRGESLNALASILRRDGVDAGLPAETANEIVHDQMAVALRTL
jgi:hypothetical protein